MQTQTGIEYWTALSYAAIDRADLPRNEKRMLVASFYALVGLLDDGEFLHPSDILYRYALCFKLPLDRVGDMSADMKAGDVTEGGAVLVEDKGERFFKFDVASPLWDALKENLDGEGRTLPQILPAYRLADVVTKLGGVALQAMWYLYFPYCMSQVAFDREGYDVLRARLSTQAVFQEVLGGRYAGLIFDDVHEAELRGLDPAVIEWYRPYIEYKLADVNGKPRVFGELQKKLARRDFEAAAVESERLLSLYPHDADILLLHIAARTQGLEGKSRDERTLELNDVLELIDTVAASFPEKAVYLGYYRGLAYLGLGKADLAEAAFADCLDLDPRFEPALLMQKGLEHIKAGQ